LAATIPAWTFFQPLAASEAASLAGCCHCVLKKNSGVELPIALSDKKE